LLPAHVTSGLQELPRCVCCCLCSCGLHEVPDVLQLRLCRVQLISQVSQQDLVCVVTRGGCAWALLLVAAA
jgi:hypothetical protein